MTSDRPGQRFEGDDHPKKTISICDTQPVTAEGIRILMSTCPDLKFLEATDSLNKAHDSLRKSGPNVLILDKAFGIQAILEWLSDSKAEQARGGDPGPAIVVWGVSVTEAEALRFLQAGARGILRKTAAISVVLSCLRAVAGGRNWMEDCVFRDSARADRYPRSELTGREQQVLELVEQGFKNKEALRQNPTEWLINRVGNGPGVSLHCAV